MQQKTSPWESMSEVRIILVMEMKEGKIYPMLVLRGWFLAKQHFLKTYEPTRGMWSVHFCFSISTNNFISGMDSKGESCCSMACYWLNTGVDYFQIFLQRNLSLSQKSKKEKYRDDVQKGTFPYICGKKEATKSQFSEVKIAKSNIY